MEDDAAGFLVLDLDDKVQYASGLAQEPLLRDTLLKQLRSRAGRALPTLLAIECLDEPLVVVIKQSSCGTLCIVQRSENGDPLLEFVSSVSFSADILRHFITNPYEAITVVDKDGILRYISPVHEKFFSLRHGSGVGRPVQEVIENTRLDAVLKSGRAEIGQAQEMRGTTRVVSRTPIMDREGRTVGAIGQIMFKSPESLNEMGAEISRLRHEVDFYRREITSARNPSRQHGLDGILGQSTAIQRLKEMILRVAPLDVPVLILGESGVGKEMVAHAIHLLSPRADKAMVAINTAALPATLVESELFGYEAGAFTGAERKGRRGKFEQADQSSLFLDEIGDMPLDIQVKLLRTLQDGSFQRVGGDVSRNSDFRLIAASNADFKHMLQANTFRLDLFYRISAITLRIPSLRERLEDIPLLVRAEIESFAMRHNLPPKHLEDDVIPYLQSLPWPGNVRQLNHVIDRAIIFAESDTLRIADLESISDAPNIPLQPVPRVIPAFTGEGGQDMHAAKSRVENDLITAAMLKMNGNKKKVAEYLGISRSYLYKRLAELQAVN